MSLYNMMNKTTPFTYFVLPLLGKHPEEYPRFRDCFLEKRKWKLTKDQFPIVAPEKGDSTLNIFIFTRVGGGNRESYEKEIKEMQNQKGYIRDFDDDFDCTYATFVFKVPREFKNDVELINKGKLKETSEKYKKYIINFWKEKSKVKDFYKKIEECFIN